jgi:hypothetical protein
MPTELEQQPGETTLAYFERLVVMREGPVTCGPDAQWDMLRAKERLAELIGLKKGVQL